MESSNQEDRQSTPTHTLDEQSLADALVEIVCRCQPHKHEVGYPNCHTARSAAVRVLQVLEMTGAERYLEGLQDPEYRGAYEAACTSAGVRHPENIVYGCVDCGSLNHSAGSPFCRY